MTHPTIAQAAVIGVPHERMGETLKAYVVGRGRPDPPSVVRYAAPESPATRSPTASRWSGELPLLASGKPDRAALAAREVAHAPA